MAYVHTGPAALDWTGLVSGEPNGLSFRVVADGEPMDLTGATLRCMARHRPGDDAPAMTAAATITNAAGGLVLLVWPGDQISALLTDVESWRGVWDLEVTLPGSDPVTVCGGTLRAGLDVTR